MWVPVTTKNIKLVSSSFQFLSPSKDEVVSTSNAVIMAEGNHRIYNEFLNHSEITNCSLFDLLLKLSIFGIFVVFVIK